MSPALRAVPGLLRTPLLAADNANVSTAVLAQSSKSCIRPLGKGQPRLGSMKTRGEASSSSSCHLTLPKRLRVTGRYKFLAGRDGRSKVAWGPSFLMQRRSGLRRDWPDPTCSRPRRTQSHQTVQPSNAFPIFSRNRQSPPRSLCCSR